MTAPEPHLTYYLDERPWQTYLDVYSAMRVEVARWDSELHVYVSGPLRKKDGIRGMRWNTIAADLRETQPDWLQDIIRDARRRLS